MQVSHQWITEADNITYYVYTFSHVYWKASDIVAERYSMAALPLLKPSKSIE
jgi:hypothetical protein